MVELLYMIVRMSNWPHHKFLCLQTRYPSALRSFQAMMHRAKDSKLVMFLDYDGTLSPIVDDPDRAFMSSGVRI